MVKVRISPTYQVVLSGVMVITQAATGCAVSSRTAREISIAKSILATFLVKGGVNELAIVQRNTFNNTSLITIRYCAYTLYYNNEILRQRIAMQVGCIMIHSR